jgi:hypothetical protein
MVAKRSTRARAVAVTSARIHSARDTGNEEALSLSAMVGPDEDSGTAGVSTPGGVSSPGGDRYPNVSGGYQRDDDSIRTLERRGDHAASGEVGAASDGDQMGSGGARGSTRTPDDPPGKTGPPNYAASLAKVATQRERDERNRAPGTWMPGPEDLDRDPEPADSTDFGTDGPERDYSSRQLGIRLRPKHWERLLDAARMYGVRPTTMARMMIVRGTNAIYEAEMRARAREWRESGSE